MRKFALTALAATLLSSSAYADILYTGSDVQDGVTIEYSIKTNGALGVLALSDIRGSSISFTGSSASRYGAFATFTATDSVYFLNTNEDGVNPVSATADALLFDFGNGGGLNFDFQSFIAEDGSAQSIVYALAARGINDNDAVVYGHGDLATRELDNPGRDGYNNLGDGTYTVVDPSLQVFATASVAAVPEPATWAMMVGGFGLVGAGLRRRKVAVSFG